MAGSDATKETNLAGPSIILVEPQLGENIGAAARAMANGGLTDLRLVRPREPWPNPKARASASGADAVLDAARIFTSATEATADLRRVFATTARLRDMVKPVYTPRQLTSMLRREDPRASGVGILFGPERTGLRNEHLTNAEAVVVVPLNPAFSSLNLAQAVVVLAYEWYQTGLEPVAPHQRLDRGVREATHEELETFFRHLEQQLDAAGFLRPAEKRPLMVQNLRNVFSRSRLTEQEVRTLHGVIRALSGKRWEDLGPRS